MAYTFAVPNDYGYVLLVSLGAIPVLSFVQGILVGVHRKPAKVPYPNAYASLEQVEKSKDAYKFNCAQRAHGQLLENMPQTMLTMLVGGLTYPRAVAALGLGWIVCRTLYAYGYITSDKPQGKGRMLGAWFWVMQGGIWGSSVATAVKMLR